MPPSSKCPHTDPCKGLTRRIDLQVRLYLNTTNRTFPSSSIIHTMRTTSACIQMATWRKCGILLSFATTRTLTDDFFGSFCGCSSGCSSSRNGGTERGDTALLKSLRVPGLGCGLLFLFVLLRVYAGLLSTGGLLRICLFPPDYEVVDMFYELVSSEMA